MASKALKPRPDHTNQPDSIEHLESTNLKTLKAYFQSKARAPPFWQGSLADYPAMSFIFLCWHSRKWWPPIRGGTLQMLVLWPEKLNQIDSFCKSGILYAWGGPRSIERCKKHGAPPKKIVFPRPICHFLSLSWKVAATNQNKMILAWKVAATNQDKMILAWKVAACLRFSFLQEIFSNWQWFFLVLVGIYEF